MLTEQLEAAFHPRSIAVAGASGNPFSMGYRYVSHLISYGYQGQIYPVTPNWPEVLGHQAYPSLLDIPGPVDYVISCLSASRVLDLIEHAHRKGVKVIHFFTGRFSETGSEDAARMEQEVLKKTREYGIRLIGPNSMGLFYPREGISFAYEFPKEPGRVGMFMQSGGASIEFIHYAALRGTRFSKVISYGNGLDLNEADLLEYFAQDPETDVIAAYIEGVKDGRRFLRVLSETVAKKPVIILKAGRSGAGAKAAASHTAALAGSMQAWDTAMRQAGAVQASTLEDMIDLVVAFDFLPPVRGTRVGVVGGGGGKSVLSADEWAEAGFDLAPFTEDIEEQVRKTLPELWWGWLRNPVDVSIFPEEAFGSNLAGTILKMMAQSPSFDLVISNVTVGGPFSSADLAAHVTIEVNGVIELSRETTTPLAVVLNTGALGTDSFEDVRWKSIAEQKARLVEAGVPIFTTASQAAQAIYRVYQYHQRKASL